MSYDLTNDADEPDGPGLPGISEVVLRRVRNGCIIAVGLFFAFLILWWLRTVYTDLLWYGELGYRCLLYTSPSPRDVEESRMPSSA